jgi:TetR/AcrR family transcriptional regulator
MNEHPKSPPKPGRARRGKGRPAQDGSSVGKELVIAAARELLRRQAPLRISRVDVAKQAGIDPGLIRYYFGSASGLLTEVILTIASELDARRGNPSFDAPVAEKVRQRLRALIATLDENPFLHQLLLQRVVHGEESRDHEIAAVRNELTFNAVKSLQSLIDEGVAKGVFRPIDARQLYIAVIGMCEFAVNAFPLFGLLGVSSADRADALSGYVDFLTDLLVSGLSARLSV